ncbi:MAG TPA: glycoside hydrolase family 2 TIM barrel-domain containing protein [Daejeonella sp.]|nr:glycoside hydrolase family 2 TIM barrel-domain containing protein [Daejeonella sp.]
MNAQALRLSGYFQIFSMVLFFLSSCSGYKSNKLGTVHIESKSGKFTLYRNGQPYFIKGAAGFTNLKALREAGGNTIRTWDTTHVGKILDEAQANHLAVIIGLEVPHSDYLDYFYNDPVQVSTQFNDYKKVVEKYKDHPALLMWCVGNELAFPFRPRFNKFYKHYNALVNMVHEVDPNHPVTTAQGKLDQKDVFNIKLRTNTDIISFNVFGGIKILSKQLKDFAWYWDGPYIITEWAMEGPWYKSAQTPWGASLEGSSTKKAEEILQTYRKFMPVNDPRFLGSMVFYWGQKQEITHTWFSLFSPEGAKSETVGTMQYIWTGKGPEHNAPQIKYMLVDGKGARDSLIYKPNTLSKAELFLEDINPEIADLKWEILPEDWFKKDKLLPNMVKPKPINGLIVSQAGNKLSFKMPAAEGPYRIFASVYDKYGNFATCNTPFYVVNTQ